MTGVVDGEPVQELETAVQVAQPGQRHPAPERDLREDRPGGAALDHLVPERDRLGGAVLQEPRDARAGSGATSATGWGGTARSAAVERGLRLGGIAPPERQEPEPDLGVHRERRAAAPSGSAARYGALGAGRGRRGRRRSPRAARARRARRRPPAPGRRADRWRGSPRRPRAPPGSCPRRPGRRRTRPAPRRAGTRRTRRRTRRDPSGVGSGLPTVEMKRGAGARPSSSAGAGTGGGGGRVEARPLEPRRDRRDRHRQRRRRKLHRARRRRGGGRRQERGDA